MLVRAQTGRADRYLAEVRRTYPHSAAAVDYDEELALAQVRQGQGRWDEAMAIYIRLSNGFPQSGYGTASQMYFLWEAEIDIGRAEVLTAQGHLTQAAKIVSAWKNKSIGRLEPRLERCRYNLHTHEK